MRYEFVFTKRRLIELAALLFYTTAISWFALVVRLGFTEYILLYALPPLTYFLARIPRYAAKTLIESCIISLVFVFGIDILAHLSGAWVINGSLGYTLYVNDFLDNFIWGALYVSLVLAGYQYFFDRYKTCWWSHRFWRFLLVLGVCYVVYVGGSALMLWLYPANQGFFYLSVIVPMILLTVVALLRAPALRHKVLLWGGIVFVLSVIYEYVALKLDQWTFSSETYLFTFYFAGHLVPIEEFL